MPSLWADSLDEHRTLVLGRLLDAYDEVRREVGVEGVTLAAVAARAGLARSAIYNYVDDKHALILAHAHRVLDDAVRQLRAVVQAQTDPPAKLAAYITHTMRMHAAETAAADDLMPMLSPEEQRELLGMLAPLRDLLATVIDEGVATGVFRGEADQLVQVVWATLGGYRMPVAAGQLEAEAAAAAVTGVLLGGMVAAAPRQ